MPSSKKKTSERLLYVPEVEVIVLALLSIFVVQSFRCETHRWVPGVWLETIFLAAVPVGIFIALTRQLSRKTDQEQNRKLIQFLQCGAIAAAGLAILVQIFWRSIGLGDANEIVALLAIQNAGWYLAVFGRFGTFKKTAFILCTSMVMFVCFIAESTSVLAGAVLFAVIALWWLLGNYWNRLNLKALDADSTTLPISSFAILFTAILLAASVFAIWFVVPRDALTSLRGFSPFSGGIEGTESDYARSGFGDGNMLVAGDNAEATGAVDSDQFIEDGKPSIYDVTVERFDGPRTIKLHKNRAIALDKQAKHLHEAVEAEQAGKTFRTVRNPKTPSEMDLESRRTKALLFVEGSVPARFAIDCFQHFDGWDWEKVSVEPDEFQLPSIGIETHIDQPWYVVNNLDREYLTTTRPHRIKMMRLETNVIPASPFLKGWHIYEVDNPDMFYWNDVGMVRMDGGSIPTQTMIDIVSQVPNYHVLRSSSSSSAVARPNSIWDRIDAFLGVADRSQVPVLELEKGPNPDSMFLQVADNESRAKLDELVSQLTRGKPRGWQQIESIIGHLRQEYVLDPSMVAHTDGRDSVSSFLEQGGGPSYLFATTATQMLRAAGYRTRLTKGFFVGPDDYDRTANQSIVTSENLHMWPEVCLDGWNWIPVEPTPGYPIPYSHQTLWQWTAAQIANVFKSIVSRPITSTLVFVLTIGLFRFRRAVTAFVFWLAWLAVKDVISDRYRLMLTRKLIDLRFWAAGIPRPGFKTISEWFLQVDDQISQDFFHHWQIQNYRTEVAKEHHPREVALACKKIAGELSFVRINSFVKKTST